MTASNRKFWSAWDKLGGDARAALLGSAPNWKPTPSYAAKGRPSTEELAQAARQKRGEMGCCWHCRQPHHGLFSCMYCGCAQPLGQWRLPLPVWPPFDEGDDVLAFGAVGFIYGEHFINHEWVCVEPDAERRKRLLAEVNASPVLKREANKALLAEAIPGLLEFWREHYGMAEAR